MTQQSTTSLIPRKVLFGNPDKTIPRISPDGARIAYLAPLNGVLNVWVCPADDLSAAKPVTNDAIRGIRIYFWAFTSDHILYLQDKAGDENWHVHSVDLNSGNAIDLTPIDGVHAQIQEISERFPNEIVVGMNDRDASFHDLYRINISTGERTMLIKNSEGFAGYLTDDDFNVRFASRMTPDGGSEFVKRADNGVWEPFMKIGMDDLFTTNPMGFDKAGSTLYVMDSRDRDTAAMTTINLHTGEQTVVAESPKADASDIMLHPTEHTIQAVAFSHERKEWQIIDDSIADDLEYLRTVSGGDVEVLSRTLDDNLWTVLYILDNGPVRFYKYDRQNRHAEFMFTNRQELEGVPLAKMTPVVIKSRDGLDLVSYYSLPISSGDGLKPDVPLPMVLLVHGGPWHRDSWGYTPIHQLLADRGYAVLSVNFRGSTGFGKSFINAANLEWGGKMHDDLIDAVQWAIDEGIADPNRVAIMGGSYGGYATLAGLTFTPQTFACGVDIVGPSSLQTLIESVPAYWQPEIDVFTTRVGDHRTDEGRAFLNERSPLTHVDKIERPLLIGQGANDPRVKQAESDQIVNAMQEKEIPVTYLLYPDEGHGFARPENNLSFFAVAEAFLAEHIGGQFEPIGDGFDGSSITVPAGRHYVSGLEAGLRDGG